MTPANLQSLARRECLGFWLAANGLLGQGAEIGCAAGEFSSLVLSQWPGERLYMVDPWASQDKEIYREATNQQADFEKWHAACVELANLHPAARLVRSLSVEATKQIDDRSLDWVYVDANHSSRSVMEDLDAWWPKLRHRGLLGGHDFCNRKDDGWFCEVEDAVKRWTGEHGLSYTVTPCTSWWVIKP
jgi:hypothetical protein